MSAAVGVRSRRAKLYAARELAFEEFVLGRPDRDHLLAETEFSAVSIGTELAAYLGEPPLRPGPVYPRLVGYCNVARVLEIGSEVPGVKVGDRIITHRCHESAFLCGAAEVLGVVPTTVTPEVATLTYLAHIGLGALQKARLEQGEIVAVLGLGVIGLATIGVARCLGHVVIALGNDPWRMDKAKVQGAAACFRSDAPELLKKIAEATHGRGIDVLVTTANSWQAWRTALEIPRLRGRIAVIGFPGRSEGPPRFNPLDSAFFYDKQLSILSSGPALVSPDAPEAALDGLRRDMATLLSFMATGRLQLDGLITHTVPWHQLRIVYEQAARHDKSLVAAILDWRSGDG
jgi:threonine dehydrogenase-like Zn-dependent dehydrogenase